MKPIQTFILPHKTKICIQNAYGKTQRTNFYGPIPLLSPIKFTKLACKPHSVLSLRKNLRKSGDHLSWAVIADSLVQSTRTSYGTSRPTPAASQNGQLQACALLDLAPGRVCPASNITVAAGGLLHHRFTLTDRKKPAGNIPLCCTCRRFTRPAVSRHRALWSADFPQLHIGEAAITRPTWYLNRIILRP